MTFKSFEDLKRATEKKGTRTPITKLADRLPKKIDASKGADK